MPTRPGSTPPLGGPSAHEADRPLRVLERRRVVVARAQAVLQHERGDADRVEPEGDLPALVVRREAAVAAARAHDDGGAVRVLGERAVDGELRLVGRLGAHGARSALGPQQVELAVAVGGVDVGDRVGRERRRGRPAVAVVHVRDDQPTPARLAPERERELADVGLARAPRVAAQDVAHVALRLERDRPQRERAPALLVVALDRGPPAHRRRSAGEHEAVFGEERRERRRILLLPGRLVVAQHARERRRQRDARRERARRVGRRDGCGEQQDPEHHFPPPTRRDYRTVVTDVNRALQRASARGILWLSTQEGGLMTRRVLLLSACAAFALAWRDPPRPTT